MTEIATLAGGCFWCTEAIFQRVRGVRKVTSGYAGGDPLRADYDHVVMGNTGHAEAIQMDYDPQVVSYETLLDIFFATHDPTSLNQQRYDIGTMYRSVIFYHSDEQREIAEQKRKAIDLSLQKVGENTEHEVPGMRGLKRVVTEIVPFDTFTPAEGYHQNFYEKNSSSNQYCTVIIDPKIKKLLTKFSDKIKEEYA